MSVSDDGPELEPSGNIDFGYLANRSGSEEGGRARFETLVHDLVSLLNQTARRIEPNPGDWGLDTFVGELDEVCGTW
jgi:hypothetical protein